MKQKFIKFFAFIALFFAVNTTSLPTLNAQCPMCKMSAESNLNQGGSAGKGLNNGILFMLATPYLLIGIVGFVWWRNRKEEDALEEA
jgi:hypothetical protein